MLTQRVLTACAVLAGCVSAAPAQIGAEADIDVELEVFGVGNAWRPGAMTAIRLRLTSALDEPVPCWVQWEVPNAEGDVGEYGRSVTLGPGSPVPVWLYAPVPPFADDQTIWTVRVFEERDGRRRGELGGTRISPGLAGATRHDRTNGLIAVVGRSRMRLEDYDSAWSERINPPGGHEATKLVSGIQPDEMPDRWEGLKAFEAIAWSDAMPQELRVDAAAALREYVRRGGHLVIVLPEAGNPWGLGARAQTWLDELLVRTAPRKDEGVYLSELMPVLSKSDAPPLRDIELGIRVFKDIGGDFDALDNDYFPVTALPDGRVIVAQRLVGFGRITLVGVDVSSLQLSSMRLPEADVFWNRILGRRSDTPLGDELAAMQSAEPRMLADGRMNDLMIGDGRPFELFVNKRGQAERGLLAAIVLFAVYFVIAGPGGFYFLKQRGAVRHAWLAFAGAAAVFTTVALGSVRVLRQHYTEISHVTVLDHVARPGDRSLGGEPLYQRAISWSSLYMPSYGTARASIESEPDTRDLLTTWAAPEKLPERFPNVDRYTVDVGRSFADYEIPVRATATQLYANWLGALDAGWGGMIRADPADPIRVARPAGGPARLQGSLVHDLPAPLSNVRLFWVSNGRAPRRSYASTPDGGEAPWVPPLRSGEMLNRGHYWSKGNAREDLWFPGAGLDLAASFKPSGRTSLQNNIYRRYIQEEEGDGFGFTGVAPSTRINESRARRFLEMLSIYHQLDPPEYLRWGDREPDSVTVSRMLGRELDLSAWFTRPCLVLIGYLQDTPTPVPLHVEGEKPRSSGLTMVRWIYPLPIDEQAIVASSLRGEEGP